MLETALYNENDPFVARWLGRLVLDGHVADGYVDQRSIADLRGADVRDATQFHAFAGIGGWSLALRLAGWPDDRPIWTGSCPCQPFSTAGRRRGKRDARHLWPEWFRLIRQCRPPVVLGEQVASADSLAWFSAVRVDLEGEGYAVGAADLCAAGVGAPHLRQRLYLVAVADVQRRAGKRLLLRSGRSEPEEAEALRTCENGRWLGDARGARGGRNGGGVPRPEAERGPERFVARRVPDEPLAPGLACDPWKDHDLVALSDGTFRPIEPGTFPLAHGVPGGVGRVRAYGNAVVPRLAATFVRAVMDVLDGVPP